jgi:hypothetical protein
VNRIDLQIERGIVDPVAIERALEGDRAVFDAMTNLEKRYFYDEVLKRSDEFRKRYGFHRAGVLGGETEYDWEMELVQKLGIKPSRMNQAKVKARKRRNSAA